MVSFDTWNSNDVHQSENENHKKRQSPWPILFDLSPASFLTEIRICSSTKENEGSKCVKWVQNKKETRGAVTRAESGPAKEKKSGA